MALTKTTRLNLAKQAAGDSPGTWAGAQNTGMDEADARFFLTGILEPNDGVGTNSNFIGQRFYDSVTGLWWTSTEIASPSVLWVSDLETLDLVIDHPIPTTFAADYPHHHLNAVLEWLSGTEVILRPVGGNVIYYDALGTRVTLEDGLFNFDISTDREGAQDLDPSTSYYVYLDNDTEPGVPLPIVSKTAPFDVGTVLAGYHPTLTDHRCIGSLWTKGDSTIAKFSISNSLVLFDGISRDHANHTMALEVTEQSAYRNKVVNVPLTATHMLLGFVVKFGGTAAAVAFAQDGAVTTGFLDEDPPKVLSDTEYVEAMLILQGRASDLDTGQILMPITVPAVPAFNYGHNRTNNPTVINAVLLGYIDKWAPRVI